MCKVSMGIGIKSLDKCLQFLIVINNFKLCVDQKLRTII